MPSRITRMAVLAVLLFAFTLVLAPITSAQTLPTYTITDQQQITITIKPVTSSGRLLPLPLLDVRPDLQNVVTLTIEGAVLKIRPVGKFFGSKTLTINVASGSVSSAFRLIVNGTDPDDGTLARFEFVAGEPEPIPGL